MRDTTQRVQYNTILTDLVNGETKKELDAVIRETIIAYMELNPQGRKDDAIKA